MAFFDLILSEKEALKYINDPLTLPDIQVDLSGGLAVYTNNDGSYFELGTSAEDYAIRLYVCCKRVRGACYGINRDELPDIELLTLGYEINWLKSYLMYPEIRAHIEEQTKAEADAKLKPGRKRGGKHSQWHVQPLQEILDVQVAGLGWVPIRKAIVREYADTESKKVKEIQWDTIHRKLKIIPRESVDKIAEITWKVFTENYKRRKA